VRAVRNRTRRCTIALQAGTTIGPIQGSMRSIRRAGAGNNAVERAWSNGRRPRLRALSRRRERAESGSDDCQGGKVAAVAGLVACEQLVSFDGGVRADVEVGQG
jgi:hypothetical protein